MYKKKIAEQFIRLIEIVEHLRSPSGCSWDREQTPKSLLPYFLEETYEVIESVESNDWKTLKEELGDVLLHILMQAQIAKESNKFDILDTPTAWEARSIDLIDILLSDATFIFFLKLLIFPFIKM